MIKDSISVGYYGLLKKFAEPSDNNTTENPGAAFQKESSAPPSDGTVALDEPTENAKRGLSLKEAPESILPVAPFAAPAQVKYNESDGEEAWMEGSAVELPLVATGWQSIALD